MPEGGFLEQKPRSPGSLAVVIALHAAAIAGLALSKMEVPVAKFTPIDIWDVKPAPPPPENPPEPKDPAPAPPKSQIDYVKPILPPPPSDNNDVVLEPQPDIPIFDPRPSGQSEPKPLDPPKPPPEPVRTEAQIDSRSVLQPPYPPSEQRMGSAGTVVVRVAIGADGRVKSAERVSASSDAFWRATERHALRHWRFRPATVDGRPVESRKQVTVHFRMDG